MTIMEQKDSPSFWARHGRKLQILTGLILLGSAIIKFATRNDLPVCDSSQSRSTLSGIFNEKNIKVKRYGDIKSISVTENERLCSATLVLENDGQIEFEFKLFYDDKKERQLLITKAAAVEAK